MLNLAEPERSIIKLTKREHEELKGLEQEVASGLSEFLRVARALSTIRNKRLFRESHPTFDQYVVERWGRGIGATGSMMTSYHIAEQLVDSGIDLPAQTTQSAMRLLSKLSPLEGLRASVWRYAVTLAPGTACPPLSLLQRISRIIRDALAAADTSVDGAGNRVDEEAEESVEPEESATEGRPLGNSAKKADPDQRFLRAAARMASYPGFSLPAVNAQVRSPEMARHIYDEVCERLKARLDQLEAIRGRRLRFAGGIERGSRRCLRVSRTH